LADVNGDLVPDVVFSTTSGYICISLATSRTGTGYTAPNCYGFITVNGGVENLVLGDFNGDGLLDIAGAMYDSPHSNSSGVLFLFNRGDGNFTANNLLSAGFATPSSPYNIAIGDFNGDGIPDIVYTELGDAVNPGWFSTLIGFAHLSVAPTPGWQFPRTFLVQTQPPFSPLPCVDIALSGATIQTASGYQPNACLMITCNQAVTATTCIPLGSCKAPDQASVILDGGGFDMAPSSVTGGKTLCLSFRDTQSFESSIAMQLIDAGSGLCKVCQVNTR
jgi:hypothetical protein